MHANNSSGKYTGMELRQYDNRDCMWGTGGRVLRVKPALQRRQEEKGKGKRHLSAASQ